MIFVVLSCLISLTTAAISHDSPRRPLSAETLLVDTRIPVFAGGHWQIMSEDEHRRLLHKKKVVVRRAADTANDDGDDDKATTTIEISVPTASASPLPSPFDGALAANFSGDNNGACPNFINNFLSNATFKACYPFSLLMQGSRSFFEAEKSLVSITQVLDATCQPDADFCAEYLGELADSLVSEANCAEDFEQQNSVVVQAHMGMLAYRTVRDAACLVDPDTSGYCFANAVTNRTTTANAYLYFLPLNSTYPARASPSCGSCTSLTMGVYQGATSDRTEPIALTYEGAAARVNEVCGADFVNATLAAAVEENAVARMMAAPGSPASTLLILLPLVTAVFSHWLS